jgi:putative ABC transport system substrate-binding protein
MSRSINIKIVLLACASLIWALFQLAAAQQPKKVTRIGYLSSGDLTSEFTRSEPIRLALRGFGYIDGQNIVIEYRFGEGKRDQYAELAAELVRLKVDIILVTGAGVLEAVKNATKTIPIVMVGWGGDPVDAGIIESLARPGGNVTGITNIESKLGGKRLYDSAISSSLREVKEDLPIAARTLKLTLQPWEVVRDSNGFERVFAALNKQSADGLYVLGGPLMRANQKRIADIALKNRLPSMYINREAVEAGGLMYYGADQADSYRRIAAYVDKILKGAKPADLPVEQPTKFELVINLKTAKQIGLTIPPNVLARADKVIK